MPNKAKIEKGARLVELAKSYSDIGFNALVDVAINGASDSVRLAGPCFDWTERRPVY